MRSYINITFPVVLLTLVFLGDYIWRKKDKKKIYTYINRIGGEVHHINKMTRDHVYMVEYYIKDEKLSKQ
jgi:calcineurin-like phosphoesterase family protein